MASTLEAWVPLFNMALIVVSGVFASVGYAFIRARKVRYHRFCMLVAAGFAALFLVVYVWRALTFDTKLFAGEGAVRVFYLGLLGSHILLAIANVPLVLVALSRALRGQFKRHRSIARVALPVWLYVAATGYLIYLMLYQLE